MLSDFALGAGDEFTVRGYVEVIRKAKNDARMAGILLAPGRPELAVLGQGAGAARGDRRLQDRAASRSTRVSNTAATRSTTSRRRPTRFTSCRRHRSTSPGVASYEVFLRGTFDWIGTYPDFLHVGDYKTAVNTYPEKTFTPAHREMSESLNRSQYDQLVRGDRRSARQERGGGARADRPGAVPAGGRAARRLIDELAYEDELDDLVPSCGRRRLRRRRGLRRGVVGTHRRASRARRWP